MFRCYHARLLSRLIPPGSPGVTGSTEWGAWYDTFVPYCESGVRETYNVVD